MTVQPPQVRPDFGDQTAFFDPSMNGHTVTIIGCGGIGASTLPTLVTMGFQSFVLWDPDVVEPRNMASQLAFAPEHLFLSKVEVMEQILQAYGADDVVTNDRLFTTDDAPDLTGIVISAVDSMAARRTIFDAVSYNPEVSLFVDGRIGGELWQMFMFSPLDPELLAWYEEFYLFDDDQAAPLPCTERAVVYPAVALGAVMASQLARFSRGEDVPRKVQQHMGSLEIEIMH